MRHLWPRLAARIPGLIAFLAFMAAVRGADGYPWGMPALLVTAIAFLIGLALEHVITSAVNTYFGFTDDDDDDDGPDDDDDPDDPIIVPDTPESLYEHAR